jgi:hypothetical protein
MISKESPRLFSARGPSGPNRPRLGLPGPAGWVDRPNGGGRTRGTGEHFGPGREQPPGDADGRGTDPRSEPWTEPLLPAGEARGRRKPSSARGKVRLSHSSTVRGIPLLEEAGGSGGPPEGFPTGGPAAPRAHRDWLTSPIGSLAPETTAAPVARASDSWLRSWR